MTIQPPLNEPVTVGQTLKKARLDKKLSLEEVHRFTKINKTILESLENDVKLTLEFIYLKNFINSYARYLGLDGRLLVERYRSENLAQKQKEFSSAPPREIPKEKPASAEPLSPLAPTPSAPVDIQDEAEVLGEEEKGLFSFFHYKMFMYIFIFILVVFCVVLINAWLANKELPKEKVITPVQQKKASKVSTVSKVKAPLALKTTVQDKALEDLKKKVLVALKQSPKITFAVKAKRETWLVVRVDGKIYFQNNIKKGAIETWTPKEKIELLISDADALNCVLNGHLLGPLGNPRQTREIVITKSGLTVKNN